MAYQDRLSGCDNAARRVISDSKFTPRSADDTMTSPNSKVFGQAAAIKVPMAGSTLAGSNATRLRPYGRCDTRVARRDTLYNAILIVADTKSNNKSKQKGQAKTR